MKNVFIFIDNSLFKLKLKYILIHIFSLSIQSPDCLKWQWAELPFVYIQMTSSLCNREMLPITCGLIPNIPAAPAGEWRHAQNYLLCPSPPFKPHLQTFFLVVLTQHTHFMDWSVLCCKELYILPCILKPLAATFTTLLSLRRVGPSVCTSWRVALALPSRTYMNSLWTRRTLKCSSGPGAQRWFLLQLTTSGLSMSKQECSPCRIWRTRNWMSLWYPKKRKGRDVAYVGLVCRRRTAVPAATAWTERSDTRSANWESVMSWRGGRAHGR